MPELPEVETVCRQLNRQLKGRRINSVQVYDRKLSDLTEVVGCSISSVTRVGKQIVVNLRKGGREQFMVVHLRMTGSLTTATARKRFQSILRRSSAFAETEDNAYVRVNFSLNRGSLLFSDVRRFGTIKLLNDPKDLKIKGLDPLSSEFSLSNFAERLARTSQSLKQFFLRQDLVVGVGNIYASEILFRAGLSPFRRANTLSLVEMKKLHRETVKVLKLAVKANGTTFSDFQDSRGESGSFQRFLKVYEREGKRCYRCGAEVIKVKQQGRSSYYCGNCQH